MNPQIQILEKPDWVSWDEIKQCLYEAHSDNREKGINMTHYQWPADKIKGSLGEKGIVFVALNGKQVVGTAAIADKTGKAWYAQGRYGYVCFDSAIPKYKGKGVFKQLDLKRENYARKQGFNVLVFDTHAKNVQRQKMALKNGYRYVRYFQANSGDHYSVVMAKWLDGCPYSYLYCWTKYHASKLKVGLRCFLKRRYGGKA